MADLTTEQITDIPIGVSPSPDVWQTSNATADELERNENIENSSYTDALGATAVRFGESNLVISGGKKLFEHLNTMFEPDENYVMDDDYALELMKQENIPMDKFGMVRDFTSKREEQYKIQKLKEDATIDNWVNNTIGAKTQMFGAVSGSIVDAPVLVGGAVGTLYATSANIMKVIAIEGAGEIILAGVTSQIRDDYTLENAFVDVMSGTFLAGSATAIAKASRKIKAPKIENDWDKAWKFTKEDPIKPKPKIKGEPEVKPVTAEDIENALHKSQDDFMDAKKGTPEYDDAIDMKKSKALDDAEEAVHIKNREEELAPNRSKSYSENRANFFAHQKNFELDIKAKRLDELDAKIKKAKTPEEKVKLTEQRDKLNSEIKAGLGKQIDLTLDTPTSKLIRIIDEMDGDVHKMKMELDALIKEDPQSFTDALEELRAIHPKEIELVEDIVTTSSKDAGKYKSILKQLEDMGVTPTRAMGGTLLMGGVGLSADDGSSSSVSIGGVFVALVALGILTPAMINGLKNKGISKQLHKMKGSWNKSAEIAEQSVTPEASQIRRFTATVSEMAHSRYTSAVAPFHKAGGDISKIADDLMYSADKGGGAEIDKASWSHSTMAQYADVEKEGFTAWKQERGINWFNNWFSEGKNINQFREEIIDATEMLDYDPDSFSKLPAYMQKTAKEFDSKLMADIYNRAEAYEVFGFVDKKLADGKTIKGVKHKKGMIPRYWKSGEMNKILTQLDDVEGGLKAIKKQLSEAFNKSIHDPKRADAIAEKFVDDWHTGRNLNANGTIQRGDDMFSAIEGLLKDDVEVKDLSDALALKKDRVARAKERIKLNANDIEPITVKINGEDITIDKSTFMERNAKTILDRTANTIHGQSALAKAGYKSTKAMTDAIAKATEGVYGGATMAKELNQITDLVLGIPIPSNNKFIHEISMVMKDVAIITKLPLVVTSMPPELINTLTTSSLGRGLRAFTKALFTKYGKDSNLVQMMAMSGAGTSMKRLDFSGFRGYSDVLSDLDDGGVVSAIREKTMKARDFSIYANGLSYFSDVLQRRSLELHLEKIASFLNKGDNTATGIPKNRLKEFGMDDETIAMFKDTFEIDKDGIVAQFDSSKWSIKKQDKLAEVLRNMQQQTSPETTIGTTGLWSRTSDLGRAMSGLLTYPMMQFNQYGLNDLKHLDRMAVVHSIGAFMGAYVGLSARYTIQGKDVSEEQKMMYALAQVPQLGAFTLMTGLMSPATFDIAKDGANLVLPKDMEIR